MHDDLSNFLLNKSAGFWFCSATSRDPASTVGIVCTDMTAEAELSPMDIATLLQQGEGQPTNLQDDLFLQELMTSQQVPIQPKPGWVSKLSI